MTIQLKDTIFINGVHQAAGTSLTLDAAAEAELVNRKVAVYTARPLTPGENETPVTALHNSAGGVYALKADSVQIPINSISSNHIGTPGQQGFGVGVCLSPPPGFTPMSGCTDPASANYGNYQYSDGSIMVWIPAFYMRIGHANNPTYSAYGVNSIDILPESAYTNETTANTHGYYRHRAFVNGGANRDGVFVDKYQCSNNSGTASSIALGMPLACAAATGNSVFSSLTGAPTDAFHGAIVAAKTRGTKFFPASIHIHDAISRLAGAHAQASASATYCAWYDVTGTASYPKGNNNGALKDIDDTSVTFTSAGASGVPLLAFTGSGVPFAKTTHNGQACGITDINGNVWEVAPGLSSIAASKNITGVTLANPLRLTITGHGYTTGDICLIASVGGTTQINNLLYQLTVVDANTISLDGTDGTAFGTYTSGGTCTVGTFYDLKTSVDIATITNGTTLSTDHWGATGIAANFDAVTLKFATTHGSNGLSQKYGNGANAVFAMDTAGNRTLAMLGLPIAAGMSTTGTNQFGADQFYQSVMTNMCVRTGGNWSYGAPAGIRARDLNNGRGSSSNGVGFRCASYL